MIDFSMVWYFQNGKSKGMETNTVANCSSFGTFYAVNSFNIDHGTSEMGYDRIFYDVVFSVWKIDAITNFVSNIYIYIYIYSMYFCNRI